MVTGGSIQGLAAESSSFRYGLFHDAVLEIEAVLSDGTVLVCSKTSNAELFHSLPGMMM
jgi:FAD/FMN-containing dehydrogenase